MCLLWRACIKYSHIIVSQLSMENQVYFVVRCFNSAAPSSGVNLKPILLTNHYCWNLEVNSFFASSIRL